MSDEQRRRALQSIAECDRFIEREEGRNADLRPAETQQLLEFYKSHRAKLQARLA
jgi:hypothetical protein